MLDKIIKLLSKTYLIISLVLLFYITCNAFIYYGIHFSIGFGCLILCFYILFWIINNKICETKISWMYEIILVGGLLLLFFVYAYSCISTVGADAYVVNYIAFHLSKGDFNTVEQFYTDYISHYTNNAPLAMQLKYIYDFIRPKELFDTWIILCSIASIFSILACFFTYKLVKIGLGRKNANFSLILIIPMIVLSESTIVLYIDVVALWTVPAAIFFLVCYDKGDKDKKTRYLYIIVAAIIMMYGIWNKPQVAVVFIALLLYWAIKCLNKVQRTKYLPAIVLFVMCSLVSISVMKSFSNNMLYSIASKEYIDDMKVPMEHFIAMGLNKDSTGAWSGADVEETFETNGYYKKKKINKQKIVNRLNEFGLHGYILHLDKKYKNTISSGEFCSSHITFKEESLNNNYMQNIIKNYLLDIGENHKYVANWIQFTYIFMLLFIMFQNILYLKTIEQDNVFVDVSLVSYITVIGLLLFIGLFEANRRYFYVFIPICIYTTMNSVDILNKFISSRKK